MNFPIKKYVLVTVLLSLLTQAGYVKAQNSLSNEQLSLCKSNPISNSVANSNWEALGTGMNSSVYSLASDTFGNLYAGGTFTSAGGTVANHIAKWNGSSWLPLASGLNGTVFSICLDSLGNVYAAGDFTYSGTTSLNHIAKWDGGNWSPLGTGMNYTVYSIVFDKTNMLYAAGSFTTSGSVSSNYIAKWNGAAWSPLGSGTNNPVYSIAIDISGNVFAGGTFTFAGGIAANRIAKWSGSGWSAVGTGVNSTVNSLVFDGAGNLYAGGEFIYAGTTDSARIAKWDGTNWSKLNQGLTNTAYCLSVDSSNNVYTGGLFLYADGLSARGVAEWTAPLWQGLGSGVSGFIANPAVYAMTISKDGDLYVGGDFTTAGDKSAPYIAKCGIPKKIVFQTDGTSGSTITGTSPQSVDNGSNAEPVTANSPTGYHFVNWTENDIGYSTDNPLTVKNVVRDMTFTAVFAGYVYTVTFQTDGTPGTYISGINPQSIMYGKDCTSVAAVPPTGYSFSKWTLNGIDYSFQNPLVVTNVTGNMNLVAVFDGDDYNVTFNTDGTIGASLIGTTPQKVIHGGDCSPVTAVAPEHCSFVNWTKGGIFYSDVNPITVTNVTQDIAITANFEFESLTITYTSGNNGSLLGQTTQVVPYGSDGNPIAAVPDPGYHFTDWSDGNTDNPRTDINVTANISVSANFAINSYTLTYSAGEHGILTGETTQNVNFGANGTPVTAVPDTGYHFIDWSDGNTDNPRTDTNVTNNISAIANFAINTYSLTYTAGANGTVTGQTIQAVDYGGNGTAVTAVPATGYHFTAWSDSSTSNPRTDTNVSADISVSANFAVNSYLVNFLTDGTPGAVLSGVTAQTVVHGSNCSPVSVSLPAGYYFTRWTSGTSDISIDNPFTAINITQHTSFTANFTALVPGSFVVYFFAPVLDGSITGVKIQTLPAGATTSQVSALASTGYHFIKWTKAGLDFSTENPLIIPGINENMTISANFAVNTYILAYTAGANGVIAGQTSQTVDHGNSGTPVTAVPNTGYHFTDWSDGNTDNPRTDTNVTGDISVTANFAINSYTLTYTTSGHGTLTGQTVQAVNHGGNGTPVTAVPDIGYHFLDWSDGNTDNPRTDINVSSNISAIANFAGNTYSLIYSAGEHGEISGQASQVVAHGQSGTPVTAIPNTGYHFTAWSDENMENPRTDRNVAANISVTANFAINIYNITFNSDEGGAVEGEKVQTVLYGGDSNPVSAVPDNDFIFDMWTLDGLEFSKNNTITVHDIVSDMTFSAVFLARPDYFFRVDFKSGENGHIEGEKLQILEVGSNTESILAVPSSGFYFTKWNVSDGSIISDNPLIIKNLQKDMIVTAEFSEKPEPSCDVAFFSGANGSIVGNLYQTLVAGQEGTSVLAKPNPGYFFDKWLVNGSEYSKENPLIVVNPANDMALTAEFSVALAMTVNKIQANTTRNESVSGARDRYSFTLKAQLGQDFDWGSGENTPLFLSLGKYFVFAGKISNAGKKRYKAGKIEEGGSAVFIEYDSSGKRKTCTLTIKWNKKREISVVVSGTPAFGSCVNIMNLTRTTTDSKGKITGTPIFDSSFTFGNRTSGLRQLTVSGKRTYRFDKSLNVYYSWNAKAALANPAQ